MFACSEIAAGETIWHCYGPQEGRATSANRKQRLRQQYFFECKCPACIGNKSLNTLLCSFVGCRGACSEVPDALSGANQLHFHTEQWTRKSVDQSFLNRQLRTDKTTKNARSVFPTLMQKETYALFTMICSVGSE
jgi:hypothetical protein